MFRFVKILSLAALMTWPAAAQTDPSARPAPSVDELVAEALAKAPALAAARSRLAAAREMETPASALDNPMIEAMIQDADFPNYTIGTEDMSMAGFEVRQPLPYPGKRRARVATARAETALREIEAVELERRVAFEVRSLYARLYAVDEEQHVLDASREPPGCASRRPPCASPRSSSEPRGSTSNPIFPPPRVSPSAARWGRC